MSKALKKIDWTKPIMWLVEDAARLAIVGRNPNNPDLMVIAADDTAICVDDYGRDMDSIKHELPPVIRNVPEKKLRPLTEEEFLASGVMYCRRRDNQNRAFIRLVPLGGSTIRYDVVGTPDWVAPDALLREYELYWPGRGWGPAGIGVTE